MGWNIFLIALFGMTILLILVDLYVRSGSFLMFCTPSFYLLLVIIYVINFFAAYFLVKGINVFKLEDNFVLVLFLSTFATMAILQSFSLRFGDYQLINIDDLIENLKNSVLADVSKLKMNRMKREIQTTANKIYGLIQDDNELYTQFIMTIQSGKDFTSAEKEMAELKRYCEDRHLDFRLVLANRITQADLQRAKNLVRAKQNLKH